MSKAIYDALEGQALLVPSGTTITASTTYAGIRCSPTLLSTSMWHLAVQASAAGGTYTFHLEASPTLGGVYTALTQFLWPPGTAGQVPVGVPASLALRLDPSHQYLRVRAVLGGSPSVTFTSWVGKPAGHVGTGSRAGDALVTVP